MFTLVPSNFFDPARGLDALKEVGQVDGKDCKVEHLDIPQYNAVLVYTVDGDSIGNMPPIAEVLERLPECPEYNKILCLHKEGRLYLAIAQGKQLLLANEYRAADFTTAEYFIFLAVKSMQINPEVSTITWMGKLGEEEKMSLYRYFKSVTTRT